MTADSEQPLMINYDARAVRVETREHDRQFLDLVSLHFPDMNARYLTADVFTDRRFGGNQLAVFPDAARNRPLTLCHRSRGSSTTPRRHSCSRPTTRAIPRKVRIFTPGGELQFAGHPTVGTAHVLAAHRRHSD